MATKESTLFNNFQSKYLVRGMRFNPDVSERSELGLLAKQCLLELGAFGITDRYQDSLLLIEQALGLAHNSLKARNTNIAPNRTRGDRLPAEVQEEINRRTRYDQELYVSATAIFHTRVSAAEKL